MAFQFLCPQGHLLQADESHAGQQSQCPHCGSLFLIPRPNPAADASTTPGNPPLEQPSVPPPVSQPPAPDAPPFPSPDSPAPDFQLPATEPQVEAEVSEFPGIRIEPEVGQGAAAADAPVSFKSPTAAQLPIVHVVCPNGHQLETPREMLDQEALCPFCQAQFRLRLEDSVEYREEKAKERTRREKRAAQLWLRWAIVAAVVVVLGLILLIVFSGS
jgi:hypothetical protein